MNRRDFLKTAPALAVVPAAVAGLEPEDFHGRNVWGDGQGIYIPPEAFKSHKAHLEAMRYLDVQYVRENYPIEDR